ncbi:MAG: hypothetical protein KAI66_02725 [Lentisphaeria bacterium]|nr:hypothetical protein [Lentisphaeria bacterium]
MVNDKILDRARAGDLAALVELDKNGLLVGADEQLDAYVERLQSLRKNTEEMENTLRADGVYQAEDVTIERDKRIPQATFAEASDTTEALYRFSIDWVPGFFINPSFSFLFGGCAYYFHPDFFALFIIRESFRERERWLIYSRRELLAHELCHVARIGLESEIFEETFAYQTSQSGFRKVVGSVFRSQADSFLLLGSTFLLLGAQVLRTLYWSALWIEPFWALLFCFLLYLAIRQRQLRSQFRRARQNLEFACGQNAPATLFRLTDEEIAQLAGLSGRDAVSAWLDGRPEDAPRWRVIRERFLNSPE